MAAFVEKWGAVLAADGHTQIPDGLLDGKITRALKLTGSEVKTIIGIIRAQGRWGHVESAKQLAFDSRVSYNQTRNNLKCLTAHKKDGGKALLTLVILPGGRTRYNWMPLRKELERLEKLEKQGGLEIVKPAPKVRPAPKPSPVITLYEEKGALAEMTSREEVDEDAQTDWEEIKICLKEEIPAPAFDTWIASTTGRRWDGRILWVNVLSTGHMQVLERWTELIQRCSRQLFGNVSVALHVALAATVGV